jgi:adenine-specific DNA-methyltransferase
MSIKELKMRQITIKKANGVVYTPDWVVRLILDNLHYTGKIEDKKIIDPACGDGAFLSIVVKRFIVSAKSNNKNNQEIKFLLENNIFGWDIDEEAIGECKKYLTNIALKYGLKNINWNLHIIDSLDKTFCKKYFNTFDFVIGNPPYVRIQNLELKKRNYIQKEWGFCRSGSTDIYLAFFELGYFLLKNDGRLGFITPNTYLKTFAGKDLRLFIKHKNILDTLIDFEHHQIFDNITTYVLITILNNNHKSHSFKLFKGDFNQNIKFIDNVKVNILNDDNWILTSNEILKKINNIEKRGTPLNKIAKIHVGIATLADNYYIFKDPVFEGERAKIKLKDGRIFDIEKNILKPIIKVSVLKSSHENQNRFIIFPYKKINNKHSIIPEEELKIKFPLTYKYFIEIKDILLLRDKGKRALAPWYAFGRSQGLDTSFGKKIITSPMNLKPNFIYWDKIEYTFYAGYCVKSNNEQILKLLLTELNSKDMEFYINYTSRSYQSNYKSYSKTFLKKFSIDNLNININLKKEKKQEILFDL